MRVDHRDLKATLGLKAHRGQKVIVWWGPLVLKDHRANQGFRDQSDPKVRKVKWGLLVLVVPLDLWVLVEKLVLPVGMEQLAQTELLASLDHRDPKVPKENQLLDLRVLLAQWVLLDLKAPLVRRAHSAVSRRSLSPRLFCFLGCGNLVLTRQV